MILYDFQCLQCQHKFEQFGDFAEPLTQCPNCGKMSAVKSLSCSNVFLGCPTPKFHASTKGAR